MAIAALSLPRAGAEGRHGPVDDTLASLVAEVTSILGDPGVLEEEVLHVLGRGLVTVSAATRLPDLAAEALFRLEPGQADVTLPADWQHGPTDVVCVFGGWRLRVLSSLAALRRAVHYGLSGRPRFAAVGAGRLFLRPRPEKPLAIMLGYYRLPRPLAASWDKPEGLPPHLAGTLLTSFACREFFERLEEGAGGNKVQTAAYGRRFDAALAELVRLYGPAQVQEEPVDIPDGREPGGVWP